MKYYEVEWKEVQTFESLVKAEGYEDAVWKVKTGEYEEEPHTGHAPTTMDIEIIDEYEEDEID